MNDHAVGEICVLLDGAVFINTDHNYDGVSMAYRLTPFGSTESTYFDFTTKSLTSRSWAPVGIKAARNAAQDIAISVYGTSRLESELPNDGVQSLEMPTQTIILQIWDDAYTAMKRQFNLVEGYSLVNYTVAMQQADFGMLKRQLRVLAKQLSPLNVYGFEARKTV
jgi:hypothetical protein